MFLSVGSEEAAAGTTAARARSESFYLDARDTNSRSTNERTSEPKKECKRFAINFEISIPGIFSPVAASAGDEIREILGVFFCGGRTGPTSGRAGSYCYRWVTKLHN